MCGFVGVIDGKTKKEKKKIIKDMADMIIHRGPDSDGYFVDNKVALGFRRLSIIDLKGGSQPIYNEDKSLVIVFNGEIYNYKEIKEKLLKKGHIFKTNTDTEVILHGYEEYGTSLFSKLRGMFAFTIYDINKDEVIGVRDFFGIKPYYYYKNDDTILLGSEIKAFLKHPSFIKEVNKKALKMYLIFQYSVFEETFFKNVYKLKPGHYFIYKNKEFKTYKYFNIKYNKKKTNYYDCKSKLKNIIASSVEYHQITSDVEVGAYLSGGVDSSYVVSLSKPDKTFSVGFDNKGFDETIYAKELSNILNINNYSKHISKDDFFNILPTILYHTDEPHANLSTVPLYFLSSLASKQVKVVLSGEGADEMFGGYNEYYEPNLVKLYMKMPSFIKNGCARLSKKMPHFPGKNTIIKYSKPFMERYIGHAFVMDEEEANEILNDDLKSNQTITDVLKPYYKEVENEDELTKKMYIDMHFWLPQDILLKADKMTMANSLELRVPFMDRYIWEFAKSIPNKYLIKNKQTKYIFREIAKENIPISWAKRRKLGFPVPFSIWIKEQKYYNIVKKYFNEKYVDDFFDKKVINNLLEEHYQNKINNGRKIYNIFIFLIWYKRFFIDIK